MTVLALDLGTKCGHAIGLPGGAVVSGVWDLSSRRFEGGGMRYLRFRQHLDEVQAATPLAAVPFEEVRNHKGVDAAHVYGGLLSILSAWCEEHNIPYQGIPVGAIKRHATGKGNANKEAMVAAARALGFNPADDNEADALHVLRYWRDRGS